jgi:hypothetical protein
MIFGQLIGLKGGRIEIYTGFKFLLCPMADIKISKKLRE